MARDISYSIVDQKGQVSTMTVQAADSPPLTDVLLAANLLGQIIKPLVDGGLVKAAVTLPATVLAWTATPEAGADVQEKGTFVLRTANGFLKRLSLPTFDEAFITAASDAIDAAAPLVAAFITALTDGVDTSGSGGAGVVTFVDTRDEDLTSLQVAYEDWGKRRA